MKRVILLSALAVFICHSPALAKEGPYVGVGLAYVDIIGESGPPFDFSTVDPSIGLDIRVGYNFGRIALEGNFIASTHHEDLPEFSNGDFTGFNLDLRVFLTHPLSPNQVYFLGGLGWYTFDETDIGGNDHELEGGGFNLGLGFEHYFNPQVALDVRGVYRFISYEYNINGVQVANNVNGDTFTLGVALNFYF